MPAAGDAVGPAHQFGKNFRRFALPGELAAGNDGDLVGDLQNALLMGDDDHGAVQRAAQALENGDEVVETPQVDARLRLVEDGQPRVAQKHGGNLNALDVAAGQRSVHFAVDILARAKAHLAEHFAQFGFGKFLARGQLQKLAHDQSFEAHRLLKGVTDAFAGAFRDVQGGDVLAVEEYAPLLRRFQAGDNLGERRLAAAVGTGDDHEGVVGHSQAYALQNTLPVRGAPTDIL